MFKQLKRFRAVVKRKFEPGRKHEERLAGSGLYPNAIKYSAFGPIIVNVLDEYIGGTFCNGGYYDLKNISYLKKLVELRLGVSDRAVLFDVGCNVGSHSLALSKLFGDRIQIHAFEAQRPIFHMFCGTMALNNVNNVIGHLAAVSDRDGEVLEIQLPDYFSRNNFGGFELIEPVLSDNQSMVKGSTVQKVRTIRIDAFDERIDVIKMDIEGMEDRALAGARKSIEISRPFCLVEVAKTDVAFVSRFFGNLDYAHIEVGDDTIFIPKESEAEVRALCTEPF